MALPRWWDRERQKRNARTRKQERQHADATGGRQQPGSGSSWRAPGDVRTEAFLDELKWTDGHSFTIPLHEWNRHRKKARLLGREPRMIVDYMKDGRSRLRLVIIEEPVWPENG